MKYVLIILQNIRSQLPYFLIIVIYFLFVNLEASKEKSNLGNSENEIITTNNKSNSFQSKSKISIPVIPYNN